MGGNPRHPHAPGCRGLLLVDRLAYMAEPEEFSVATEWEVSATVQHPPGVKLDDKGHPVIDADGNPVYVGNEEA